MLKAYPEPGPTRARAGLGPLATTTLADTILAELVDEGLEPQLEHSGGLRLKTYQGVSRWQSKGGRDQTAVVKL